MSVHMMTSQVLVFLLFLMIYSLHYCIKYWYWYQRADEEHGKPLQGNQELLVVKDKVGRPTGEFGVSKSIGCDIFTLML